MLLIWLLQLLECVKIQAGIVSRGRVAVEGGMSTESLVTGGSLASSPDSVTNSFWASGPSTFIFKMIV